MTDAMAQSTGMAERVPRQVSLARFVPIEAKLRIPQQRRGLVLRRRLLDQLSGSRDVSTIAISAPAGYGKTTVLSQLAACEERAVAWVSLDPADNDPAVLLSYLLLALQRVEPIGADLTAALRGGDTTLLTVALPRLGQMLLERRRPFVLVLDDVHVLVDPVCLAALAVVIQHLPPGSQVVLAGRGDVRLPLGRMRAQRAVERVGTHQLALSLDEGRALLRNAGLDLPSDDVLALVARTEGWAAGLYLAALAVGEDGGGERAVRRFTGDERLLMDYLHDELFATTSAEQVEFLTRTSILDKLTGGLCDALLERQDSGLRLRELAAANLFLSPVDARDEWYRYHDLFARMLRSELRTREPQAEPELHRRASAWFEEHGNIEEAIRHARLVGDLPRAARLLWSLVPGYISSGRRGTIERLLEDFDPADVFREPFLAVSAGWWAIPTGRSLDAWVAAAERFTRPDAASPPEPQLVAAVAALRATLARGGLERMRADAELAERHMAPDDMLRPAAQLFIAIAMHLTGDRSGARQLHEQSERLAAALGQGNLQALSLSQLSLLAVERGAWDEATAIAEQARDIIHVTGFSELPTMGPVYAMSALVLARRGELTAARRDALRAHRMTASTDHFASWFAIEGRVVLARAHLLLGDPVAAGVLLREAEGFVPQMADAPVLRDWLADLRTTLEPLSGTTPHGPSALTTAEIRVLRFLPTHLSLEEISRRLYVSRSTVKTQTRSIHRKLGVSSRTDAVERARALGLLDTPDPHVATVPPAVPGA